MPPLLALSPRRSPCCGRRPVTRLGPRTLGMPQAFAWRRRQCSCSGLPLALALPAARHCSTRLAPRVSGAPAATLQQQQWRRMRVAEAAHLPPAAARAILWRALRFAARPSGLRGRLTACPARCSPWALPMGRTRPGKTTRPWHRGVEQDSPAADTEVRPFAWRLGGACSGPLIKLPPLWRPRPQLPLRLRALARPRPPRRGRCRRRRRSRPWQPTA